MGAETLAGIQNLSNKVLPLPIAVANFAGIATWISANPTFTLRVGQTFVATNGDAWEWQATGVFIQTVSAGSDKVATADESAVLTETSIRTAVIKNGGAAIVPDTSLSAINAADLIKWTYTAGKKYFAAMCGASRVAGNNTQGWWITINAGSAIAALDRLREALDTATGQEISVYAAGATIQADENKAGFLLPNGCKLEFKSDDDITDVYAVPIADAASAVGSSILSVLVS